MAFQIVPHRNEYREQAASLIVGIQKEEFGIPISLAEQPDLLNVEEFYREGKGDFWIAVEGDRVIGTIALKDIGSGQGALRKMFVDRDRRGAGTGVAASLLNHLLVESKRRGFREVILGTTEAFQAAHRFYEKHRFRRIEASDLPSTFPRMVQDTRYYRRSL
jgi:N-acetylglutamate synthase-like GNAT family acetyltransferase